MRQGFVTGSGSTVRLAFTVTKRFGPDAGEPWTRYVAWARLPQLRELVSFDRMLCPRIVESDCDEDWAHNVHEDFAGDLFWDVDYLRGKMRQEVTGQLLALARNPHEDPVKWAVPAGFVFAGHDLVDDQTSISALTNCGGFDDVFRPEELSEVGLIRSWSRAGEIQRLLAERHPEEPHAQCSVWSLWHWDEPAES